MKKPALYPPDPLAYGGELLRTRRGRAHARPIGTRAATMHFVLRSTKAQGAHSFRRPRNAMAIRALTGAIALFVAGRGQGRFWDRRPFSRVVVGRRGFLTLRNYVQINLLEEIGLSRTEARLRVALKALLPGFG